MIQYVKNLFKYREVDPHKDEKKINYLLFLTENWMNAMVIIVSSGAAGLYGWDLAGRYTELIFFKFIGACFFFCASAYVTDLALKHLIQKVAYDFLVAFNPDTYKNSAFSYFQRGMQVLGWAIIAALVVALYWFDYQSVLIVSEPVAARVKQEKNIDQVEERQRIIDQERIRVGSIDNAIREAKLAINQLKSQITSTEKQVEQKNPQLTRLVGHDQGWANLELVRKKKSATAQLNKQIESQTANLSFLITQKSNALNQGQEIISNLDKRLMNKNQQIDYKNQNLIANTGKLVIYFGFGLKILAGLIRVLIVVLFLAGKPTDANNDGEINYLDANPAVLGFPRG